MDGDSLLQQAIQWAPLVLGNLEQVQLCLGKAAALVWLYDEVEFYVAATAFRLALNAYTRLNNDFTTVLNDLVATDFRGLVEWIENDKHGPVNRNNLGVASYFMRRWDHCIRLWTSEEGETQISSFRF